MHTSVCFYVAFACGYTPALLLPPCHSSIYSHLSTYYVHILLNLQGRSRVAEPARDRRSAKTNAGVRLRVGDHGRSSACIMDRGGEQC